MWRRIAVEGAGTSSVARWLRPSRYVAFVRAKLSGARVVQVETMRRAVLMTLLSVLALAPAAARAGAPPPAGSARPQATSPFAPRTPPPWLGIEMANASEGGARVVHVVRGAPAALAGLRDGDRVVKVDGTAVDGPSDVTRLVSQKAAGSVLDVTFVREGTERRQQRGDRRVFARIAA